MNGALVYIIAESHHEVANVHHDGSLDGGRFDPLPLAVQNLQTTRHVLPQQREQLQIGMASQPHGVVRYILFRRDWVIVEDPISARVRRPAVEIVFCEIKTQRKDLD